MKANRMLIMACAGLCLAVGCVAPKPTPKPAPRETPAEIVQREKEVLSGKVLSFTGKKQFVEAGCYLRDYQFSDSTRKKEEVEIIQSALKAVRMNLMRDHVLDGLWRCLASDVREGSTSTAEKNGWLAAAKWIEAQPSDTFRSRHVRIFELIDQDVFGSKELLSKLAVLKKDLFSSAVRHLTDEITDKLVKDVDAAIQKGDIVGARKIVNTCLPIGYKEVDIAVIGIRIGILNHYVNWRDYAATLAQIEKVVSRPLPGKVEDLERMLAGLRALNVTRVDTYVGVGEAMAKLRDILVALKYVEPEYASQLKAYGKAAQDFLDGRVSKMTERDFRDFSRFDEAMEAVRQAIAQHDTRPFARKLEIERTPLTTAELNRRLLQAKNDVLGEILMKIAKMTKLDEQEKAETAYRGALALLREDIDLESQINKAEHVFRRMTIPEHLTQHKIVDGASILTEYARVLRKLAVGQRAGTEDATAMLVGAAVLGELRVAKWAVKLGADVNGIVSLDVNKTTALMAAMQEARFEFAEWLTTEMNASYTMTDARGRTALFYALEAGDLPIVKMALPKSDVNVADKNGERPIFIAARWNRRELFDVLVKSGARLRENGQTPILNGNGDSVFEYAARHGLVRILDDLFETGWQADVPALVKSILSGQLASVKWMVEHGACVEAPAVREAVVKIHSLSKHKGGGNGTTDLDQICDYLVKRGVRLQKP